MCCKIHLVYGGALQTFAQVQIPIKRLGDEDHVNFRRFHHSERRSAVYVKEPSQPDCVFTTLD